MKWVELKDREHVQAILDDTSHSCKVYQRVSIDGVVSLYHVSYDKTWPEHASLTFDVKESRFSFCYFKDCKAYSGTFKAQEAPDHFMEFVREEGKHEEVK